MFGVSFKVLSTATLGQNKVLHTAGAKQNVEDVAMTCHLPDT